MLQLGVSLTAARLLKLSTRFATKPSFRMDGEYYTGNSKVKAAYSSTCLFNCISKIIDDDVACVQLLVRNLGIPRILRNVTCKKLQAESPPIFHQFCEDKQRSRHLVPVAVNQLKIFSLPKKKNESSAGK